MEEEEKGEKGAEGEQQVHGRHVTFFSRAPNTSCFFVIFIRVP